MSILADFGALHLLEKAAAALGQDCALCGGRSGGTLICTACEASLARAAHACIRCAAPLATQGLCGDCLRHPPPFDAAAASFEYRYPLDRLVQRFKFGADLALGRWLASRLAETVGTQPRPQLLVAPPLGAARLRERGFNQALEIAKVVGRARGVRVDLDGLVRLRETLPQPGLGPRARRANLRAAFRCRLALAGEHVAIVDDVMTTGATAAALALALKAAGAGRVSAWAVARTAPPRR